MYEQEKAVYPSGALSQTGLVRASQRTVGENIDMKINELRERIKGLEDLKVKLASPNGLLAVSISDLRDAMNY